MPFFFFSFSELGSYLAVDSTISFDPWSLQPYPALTSSSHRRYQQLELKHIDDKGCYGAMEFR